MERGREAYWLRHPGTSPTKLRWRALTVKNAFHVLPGERILELGAGSGLWTAHLADVLRGECPLTAVVFNESLAARLRQRELPNVTVVESVDLRSDLEPESFDYVVGTAILCHDEYGATLGALLRLLKPGGQLLFFEANFWNPQVFLKVVVPALGRRAGHTEAQIGMRKFRLLQETSRQGFTEIEVIPYDIVHPRTPERLIPALQETAYVLERLPVVRELCGTLYIWARKPGKSRAEREPVDLGDHASLHDSVSVVVPCHDEEAALPRLVRALTGFFDQYIHQIVVVDDCSSDRTREVAAGLATADPRITVVPRNSSPGVGNALRAGYAAATGRYVLSLDCDFEAIVPELRGLFDVVAQGHDGAIGSRFSHESVLLNYPLPKIVANRSFHFLLRAVLRRRVRDVSNNLKLYRTEIVRALASSEPGFAANAEIGIDPLLAGYDIVEVPISWINRTPELGRSKFHIPRAAGGYARVLARVARGRYGTRRHRRSS
jgi:SAM-dependent methyltransferase